MFTLAVAACSPAEPVADEPEQPALTKEAPVDGNGNVAGESGPAVANLPFSHGKSFRTLDEYLAHLERNAGPIDQPWWREIRPGVYEHVKRMPGAPRETATRAELMRRFGFSS